MEPENFIDAKYIFTGFSAGGGIANTFAIKVQQYLKTESKHQNYLDRVKAFTFGASPYPPVQEQNNDDFSPLLYNIVSSSDALTSFLYQGFDISKLRDFSYESQDFGVLNFIKGLNEQATNMSIIGNFLFLEDKKWNIEEYNPVQLKEVEVIMENITMNFMNQMPQSEQEFKKHLFQKHDLDNYLLKLNMWLGGLEYLVPIVFNIDSELIDILKSWEIPAILKKCKELIGMEISADRDSNLIKSSNGIVVECRSQQYIVPPLKKILTTTREESNSKRDVRLKIILQPNQHSTVSSFFLHCKSIVVL